MKKNTYTLAYEACESYFSETGLMPTIESIKPIIQVNSPTTISNAIKDWKLTLSQSIKKPQYTNPTIPNHLISAINEIWENALTEARNTLNEQKIDLQSKQSALEEKEISLVNESSRIQQLVDLTEQKYNEKITYLQKELSKLSNETSSMIEKMENYRMVSSNNEKLNAVLTEQVRQEQDKYKRLENQFNKTHEWALKRIEEEKIIYRHQIQIEMDRLKSEANRSKQAGELLQAKFDLMTKQINKNNEKIIELENQIANQKLKQAEQTLNEVKLQKELHGKEEKIRSLLKKIHKTAN